tara:strand:+ start:251 stop:502 length:252 start_codon:yes stop_codon:yes gene_type:complete
MKKMITDKTIKKEIVRKAILKDYVETCMITGHCINDVLGMTLTSFDYTVILNRLRRMNEYDKFLYVNEETILWYEKLITLRSL